MRNLFLLIMLGISIITCSQNDKKEIEKKEEIMNIDIRQNFVKYLKSQVKYYDKEPIWFYYVVNRSYYELYTNDLPTQKYYGEGGLANRIEFNQSILKTGKQKIRIRIFPEDENAELSFYFRVKIGYYYKDKPRYDDHIITKEIEFQKSDFTKTGENIYETIYEFEAEVPYENIGWSEGQDLRKFEYKKLEDEVLKKYQSLAKMILDKQEEHFLNQIKYSEGEIVRSSYSIDEDIENIYEDYAKMFTTKNYDLQPIENYKMVIYGDGKMVALENTSLDRKLRGKSSLWAKYKRGQSTVGDFTKIFLYLPQGKSLENGLEIIR